MRPLLKCPQWANAMAKKTPRRGQAAGRGSSSQNRPADSTPSPAHKEARPVPASAPTVDLVGLRDRLLTTRARLLEQVANDWEAGRHYPDTSWCRMLSDVQGAIQAVADVMDEDGP